MKGLLIVLGIFVASASANFAAQYYRADLFVDNKYAKNAIDPLIIGGTDADIADFPFQLSLRVNGNHRCGASIISTQWILSAAHCLDDNPAIGTVTWRGGSANRLEGGVIFTTVEYIFHPDYSIVTLDNDIVVARSNELLQGTNIAPANLAPLGTITPAGTPSTTTGWGVTTPGGTLPVILQEVTKPIVGETECGAIFAITENMICSGALGLSGCNGDSGGPLTLANGMQVGVVSFGPTQCGNGLPGVYARVAAASVRNFISSTTGV